VKVITKSLFEDIKMWSMGTNLLGRPQMYVYSYLVDGLLIDTGQPRIRKKFLAEIKDENIDKIIVTHHHEDHSGNIEAIKKSKGIQAFGSKKCAEILTSPPIVTPAQWITWGQNGKANLKILDISQPIKTHKYSFQVIMTPGHAEDQISLYERNRGWLFSGDLYINSTIKIFMTNEFIDEQISSIKTLMRLDFDVLLCCHNPKFVNGKKYLKSKLEFLENFYDKVAIEFEKGLDAKQIMKVLNINEDRIAKAYSLGRLSKLNMVKSVIRSELRKNV